MMRWNYSICSHLPAYKKVSDVNKSNNNEQILFLIDTKCFNQFSSRKQGTR